MTRGALTLLLALVAMLFLGSLLIGPAGVSPLASLKALFFGGEGPLPLVMREIRLPRALLALMIGGSLGLSGAALQGYLRNPLAEPGLIGVSGGAALGAVISLQTGFAVAFPLALPIAALSGALGSGPAYSGPCRAARLIAFAYSCRGGDQCAGGGVDLPGAEFLAQPLRGERDCLLDDGFTQ